MHSQYRQETEKSGQLPAPVALPSAKEPSIYTERRQGVSHGRSSTHSSGNTICTSPQTKVQNPHIAQRLSRHKTRMSHAFPYYQYFTWSVSISVGGFVTRLPGLANTALLCVMVGLLRRSGGASGTAGNLLIAHSFTPHQVPRVI